MYDVRTEEFRQALEAAWLRVNSEFPFGGYIRKARKPGYVHMVQAVYRWAGPHATVLDFGAGPCDKTALFSLMGMEVTAFDPLQDAWHTLDNNREKILSFARSVGIDYHVPDGDEGFPFPDKKYDVLMLHNVIEHLHSSPRGLLNRLLCYVRPGGTLAITVPNAGNLRKRIHLLLGGTNYNRFEYFYWYPGVWHGHIREYVRQDLLLLSEFLGLEVLDLGTYHLQLDGVPSVARPMFVAFSVLAPGTRDSWMLIARKPLDWEPRFRPSSEDFQAAFGSQYYDYSAAEFEWEE